MNADVFQASTQELENCAKEPIHLAQRIQSHGMLLAIDSASGRIEFASENVAQHLGYPASDVLGQSITDFLLTDAETAMERLRALRVSSPASIDLLLRCRTQTIDHFEIVAHRQDTLVVLEAMPYTDTGQQDSDSAQMESVVASMGALHFKKSVPEFLEQCALEIRKLSGYQRVIIYRFLPDWSGEVLAESVSTGMDIRFQGLRFPASDIPEQARTLYKSNLLRVIGDVQAQPVEILARSAGAVLDQSHSILRSPSPMHLGYLQNMGVRATMTISLLNEGELWGMVSCHHDLPRTPPVQLGRITKLLCALVAETAIVRIDAIEQKEISERALQLRNALNHFAASLHAPGDFDAVLIRSMQDLLPVLGAQAYGVALGGRVINPMGLGGGLLASIETQAAGMPPGELLLSSCLTADTTIPSAIAGEWSGLALIPIPGMERAYLFLLRLEVTHHIRWAGAPESKTHSLPGGLRVLGARASFAEWTQSVLGKSKPWGQFEGSACREIAQDIADVHNINLNQVMRSNLQMLGSCMERLNDMVVVTDTHTGDALGPRIVYVNDEFVKYTGYTRREALGRNPRFLQGKDTDPAALAKIRHAIALWKPITLELINYKKDGTPYWVEIALAPVADSAGTFIQWVAIERDIGDRKSAQMDIQKLVYYDSLTGLPNRRMLIDRLQVSIKSAARHGRNGALLFVDLDNFKDLNDTAGHHVGDELLRQVAQRLSAQVRDEDTVARLGGDEFVVMLEGLGAGQENISAAAQFIALKLIRALDTAFELSGQTWTTSASIGITLFQGNQKEQSADDLLKQADIAMYQAKSAGRNAWSFYDPATQAALVARSAMEVRLKDAVQQQGLEIYFQPIVDRSMAVTGVEALLRWNDSHLGWISPVEFIPIAERNGLIVPMGHWVLEQTCQLLKRWESHPIRALWTVAVNVSARQIRQVDFIDKVLDLIKGVGCKPQRLKLELTESMLQSDVESTIAKMLRLQDIGVQFSIDDFGTGYSSLNYLRQLPLSVLKIDRSFVFDVADDAGGRAICQTVLALGKTLRLNVIAEGVETQEQFDYLIREGCDQFQGYLFSRPIPLALLEQQFGK